MQSVQQAYNRALGVFSPKKVSKSARKIAARLGATATAFAATAGETRKPVEKKPAGAHVKYGGSRRKSKNMTRRIPSKSKRATRRKYRGVLNLRTPKGAT